MPRYIIFSSKSFSSKHFIINFYVKMSSIRQFLGDSMNKESLIKGSYAHRFHKKSYSPGGAYLLSLKSCKMSLKMSNNLRVDTNFKKFCEENCFSRCMKEEIYSSKLWIFSLKNIKAVCFNFKKSVILSFKTSLQSLT